MKAWHFVSDTLRDGSPIPPDGEWLKHKGKCLMCVSGLHASKRIIDALHYAPGRTICRVKLRDLVDEQDDKVVARERKIFWRVDGEELLRRFARRQALTVIHAWDAPYVVIKWLTTGRVGYMSEAYSEALSAAATAANPAVYSAANSAAATATNSAARLGARTAAYSAAYSAAATAANSAARSAAYPATYSAALLEALSAADEMLEKMVREAKK